jgi:hypothetical protein
MIYKKRFDEGDMVEVSRSTTPRELLVPTGRKKKRLGDFLPYVIERKSILMVGEDSPRDPKKRYTLCLTPRGWVWVDARCLTFLRGKEPGSEGSADTRGEAEEKPDIGYDE